MSIRLNILFIVEVYLHGSLGVDWCSSDLQCREGQNTLCTYRPQTSTAGCQEIVDSQTPEGRVKMLELHNEYRNKLAGGGMPSWPKAANMMEMSWSSEIESGALRWAMQCQPGHDKCRRTPKFERVGQNYGMGAATDEYPSSSGSFTAWVNEISMIGSPTNMVNNFVFGSHGHFSQVAWGESSNLGCGEVHYVKGSWKTTVVVCNYGPAGNWDARKMYEIGEPASKCPSGPSKKYPNLCATTDTSSFESMHSAAINVQLEISVIVTVILLLAL